MKINKISRSETDQLNFEKTNQFEEEMADKALLASQGVIGSIKRKNKAEALEYSIQLLNWLYSQIPDEKKAIVATAIKQKLIF